MHPLACVNIPAFPLQILCKQNPAWQLLPLAVVDRESPNGKIRWVNEIARKHGVLPGHSYSYGLSLERELRAGVVSKEEVEEESQSLLVALRQHSPDVECSRSIPGVFWINGAGLKSLYKSKTKWGVHLSDVVLEKQYECRVVVGFRRFHTYALSQITSDSVSVIVSKEKETSLVSSVPIDRLDVAPKARDNLAKLGVSYIGEFLKLPAGGLLTRYGKKLHGLHELASGKVWDPLLPQKEVTSFDSRVLFDDATVNSNQILFAVKRGLDPLLRRLYRERRALTALWIELVLENRGGVSDVEKLQCIRPAEPTLDGLQVLRLVGLRLETLSLHRGVVEVLLKADDVLSTGEQLRLFVEKPERDLRLANIALAKVRAELGNNAVVYAKLEEGHLPEAQFSWQPVDEVLLPVAKDEGKEQHVVRLVRRVQKPRKLVAKVGGFRNESQSQFRNQGWLLLGKEYGAVSRLEGPYIISGGWWNARVSREYYFAETDKGLCLWVFYDCKRKCWYMQGSVQ